MDLSLQRGFHKKLVSNGGRRLVGRLEECGNPHRCGGVERRLNRVEERVNPKRVTNRSALLRGKCPAGRKNSGRAPKRG